jgi:NADH-quinone oxidoreductase subunit J
MNIAGAEPGLGDQILFYGLAGFVTFFAIFTITRKNPVTAVMSLVATFFGLAAIYASISAHFLAVLQVLVYAGAIMVLFIFVVMLLNQGPLTIAQERRWLGPGMWVGPSLLAVVLLAEVGFIILSEGGGSTMTGRITPKQVSLSLYGPYAVAVELASMLLLPGLIGAYHLGRQLKERR